MATAPCICRPERMYARRKRIAANPPRAQRPDDASIQVDQLVQLKVPEPERLTYRHRILQLHLDKNSLEKFELELKKLPDQDEQKLVFHKEMVKRYLDAGNLEKAFEGLPQIPRSDRERNRLDAAARRLRDQVEAVALPRRIPWLLVVLAFVAGLLAGARLARR